MNKFLVVLKSPPTSFLVDSCEKGFLKDIKYASFIQDDLQLWIPIRTDSNIAYIQELSEEEVKEFKEKIAEIRAKSGKIVKPGFKIPTTRH